MQKQISTDKAEAQNTTAARNGEFFVGLVGIDSGQLIIVDPAYLENWKNVYKGDPSDVETFKKGFQAGDYNKVSDVAAEEGAGQVPEPVLHGAAVVSSTNGDGGMPVFATFVDGRVVSLRIELN